MTSNILCSLSEFEEQAKEIGVSLRAVQLVRGESMVRFGFRLMGHAILASYEASHRLALEWQTRPHSINFSIRTGQAGVQIEGRERAHPSILMYVEPGISSWAGPLLPSPSVPSPNPAFHVSLPFEGARILGLNDRVLQRGWLEVPLSEVKARAFSNWVSNVAFDPTQDAHLLQDEIYSWLQGMLHPALELAPPVQTPTHYTWIVHAIGNLLDADPTRSWLVTELAGSLRISVRTLQRAFRHIYGVSITLYLRNRRLERARQKLLEGGIAVHRAAHENGFNHVPRFSQQYRLLFGVYPSETLLQVEQALCHSEMRDAERDSSRGRKRKALP